MHGAGADGAGEAAPVEPLAVGAAAPDFLLPRAPGQTLALRGRPVVLVHRQQVLRAPRRPNDATRLRKDRRERGRAASTNGEEVDAMEILDGEPQRRANGTSDRYDAVVVVGGRQIKQGGSLM